MIMIDVMVKMYVKVINFIATDNILLVVLNIQTILFDNILSATMVSAEFFHLAQLYIVLNKKVFLTVVILIKETFSVC